MLNVILDGSRSSRDTLVMAGCTFRWTTSHRGRRCREANERPRENERCPAEKLYDHSPGTSGFSITLALDMSPRCEATRTRIYLRRRSSSSSSVESQRRRRSGAYDLVHAAATPFSRRLVARPPSVVVVGGCPFQTSRNVGS